MGLLTGLGYTIDLGIGPVLFVTTAIWVTYNGRGQALVPFVLGALPCLALHHGLNFAVGGTWRPANMVPEYLNWPGCPFNTTNMTGVWHHDPLSFFLHGGNMLVGKRGFLFHNLPLLLTVPAVFYLLRRGHAERSVVIWAVATCAGSWFLYTATSQATSGQCLTVRWFVPFLAPGYYLLALYLRRCPERLPEFVLLSGWGTLLMAQVGRCPWTGDMVPFYWPIGLGAISSWIIMHLIIVRVQRRRTDRQRDPNSAIALQTARPITRIAA